MLSILYVTIPIFLLIGLGYAAVRLGLFEAPDVRALSRFVIRFSIPVLIFEAVSTAPLDETLNRGFLAAYAAGSLAAFAIGLAGARLRAGEPLGPAALYGLGMSSSNSGFMGYPVATVVIGGAAAAPLLAQCMIVENFLMIPLAMALAETGGGCGRGALASLGRVARGLAKNPIVLGLAAGIAVSVSGLPLPAPVSKVIALLAGIAPPLALFVIGGTLASLPVRGAYRQVSGIVAGKLVLHPLLVLAALTVAPGVDATALAGGVLYASVPMLSIFPILGQRHDREMLCATALFATTLASFFTISALIWLFRWLGYA